jgi:hypothetical protein
LTVEPLSAEPLKLIAVELFGDAGLMLCELGASGAIVSFVKLTGSEHSDVLSAESVAVAENDVVSFDAAVTAKPSANAAASSLSTGLPEQVALSYRSTEEPASAVPVIVTSVDCDGESGLALSELGASGVFESFTKATGSEHSDVLSAESVAVAEYVVVAFEDAVSEKPVAKLDAVSVVTGLPEQSSLA